MSGDVITTDGETMINSIQNGDQPLPIIAQVSLAGNDSNETTKDLWDALERYMHGSKYGDVNDALGYKKKAVVVTSDPLELVAENRIKFYSKPTNNNMRTSSTSQSANKKQESIKSDEKKEDKKADEKKRDMSKVTYYNCKKEGHFAKDCKKAKVKDYNYYKPKMLLAKKDSDEQVLLTEDQAWMESVVILIRKSMQTWSSWIKLKRFFPN
nr:hypothetical protein [Tanacetum cinerariifolium]